MLMYKDKASVDVHASQNKNIKNRGWSDKAPASSKTKNVTKKEAVNG
jgi:hypothetical protein